MTLKQEAFFIGIAVIIGLATMVMVRLVYDEGDLEGKAAEHPVQDSLPAWVLLSIYIWLKLVTVMAKLIKIKYAIHGFKFVRSVTLTPSELAEQAEAAPARPGPVSDQVGSISAAGINTFTINERTPLNIETETQIRTDGGSGGHKTKQLSE